MLIGFLSALVLAGALLVIRGRVGRLAELAAWSGVAGRYDKGVAGALFVACAFPLFHLLPWVHGRPTTHFGDALTHVHVARDIARHGLPHGWVDTYLGGFPFGHHYPPLGTLVLAATLKVGFSSAGAAHLWGFLGTLAAPLALLVGAVRAGARPVFAAAGAGFVACVSPYNQFVGGYETFFQLGIFSQVLALPICILFASVVARGSAAWPAPLAALAMATHPQLALATLGVTGLASFVSARRDVTLRWLRGAVGAVAFGVALYGQGIATLNVPFGWPPDLGWRQIGFGTSRLDWWFFDGELIDRDRDVAVLTTLAGVSAFVLAMRLRRPAARAGLFAALAAVVLSVSGPWLSQFESVGAALLSVLQPMRVLALVPPVLGALVVIALEETAPLIRQAFANFDRPRLERAAAWLLAALVFALLAVAVPNRASFAKKVRTELAERAAGHCAGAPRGYERNLVAGFVGSLRGGRLWFEDRDEDALERCLLVDGVPLESSVPIGITGGLGSHVGIHWLAFHRLELGREGSARRAEALGIRHALALGESPAGWRVRRESGDVRLLAHEGPTELVGAGCIIERWYGSDHALRKRLVGDLKTTAGADRLLDPNWFVAIEQAPGETEVRARANDDRSCKVANVRVTPIAREPGALEAVVEAPAPVDVVFRVTAFPTWRVWVDGARAERTEVVAPGFFTTRIGPGKHRVLAMVGPMPGYLGFIALGALAVAAASFVRLEHLRRARVWLLQLKRTSP